MIWQYGITTVPRRRTTIFKRTIASLIRSGFDEPHLFIDGGDASLYSEYGLPTTCHSKNLKAMGNWYVALATLFYSNVVADRYAIFQDDFVTYRHLRDYLNVTPYPDKGYLNLITFDVNEAVTKLGIGFHRAIPLKTKEDSGKGAVALVFDNITARKVLASRTILEASRCPFRGNRGIDGKVVLALNEHGIREYVHNPSLVEHIGAVTTIAGNSRHLPAKSFMGEEFDARRFSPQSVS